MEDNESRLKLSEYSINAIEEGDISKAMDMALEAVTYDSGLFSSPPPPEAQSALSSALSIYDLSDGFKSFCTVSLPSAPLGIEISPDGKTAAIICSEKLTLYDIGMQKEITALPIEKSALSEAEFLDNDTIIFIVQKCNGRAHLTCHSGKCIILDHPDLTIRSNQVFIDLYDFIDIIFELKLHFLIVFDNLTKCSLQ